jgi:hypothetical protein
MIVSPAPPTPHHRQHIATNTHLQILKQPIGADGPLFHHIAVLDGVRLQIETQTDCGQPLAQTRAQRDVLVLMAEGGGGVESWWRCWWLVGWGGSGDGGGGGGGWIVRCGKRLATSQKELEEGEDRKKKKDNKP